MDDIDIELWTFPTLGSLQWKGNIPTVSLKEDTRKC